MRGGRRTTALLSVGTLQSALFLCSILETGISKMRVDVRCYCNLPLCVPSGYMCKSSSGVCISERRGGDPWRWRHACLELVVTVSLREMAAPRCEENGTRQCCTEDMCNYLGNVVVSPVHQRLNHSHMTGYLSNHDTSLLRGSDPSVGRPWFRVTVIAVPIAGGCVLVILVVMAVRVLKQERQRPPRVKPMDTTVVYQTEGSSLPKSLSCVLLGRAQPPLPRSYASAGSLRHSDSVSIALSTDTAATDSSKEKYFVFDV